MINTRKVFSLLLMFGSFAIANSLNCTVCISNTSWDDCYNNSNVTTCTLAGVNELHAAWAVLYNFTLVQGTAQDEFACFAFQGILKNLPAHVSPVAFVSGCTFKKVDFCKGWPDDVEVVKCETSGSGGLAAMGALVVAGFLAVYSRL